jgi:uncharacterized damage-inducible protein DinB
MGSEPPERARLEPWLERREPATDADEKAMLCGWMDFHRATILMKIDGLDDESLRRSLVPSGTSLLGLVKHLALAEHYWFTQIFDGSDAGLGRPNDPDVDWRIHEGESTDDIVSLYLESCERSRRVIATASLDDHAKWGTITNRRGPASVFTLRWILTHMIEETARHNGHADILREQLDGVTGT